MKKAEKKPGVSLAEGQLWKVAQSYLEITMIGKTLIHYRQFKEGLRQRFMLGLNNIRTIQEYLETNGAELVRESKDCS